MLPVPANRDVYRLLREGVTVDVKQPDGSTKPERVALIDWTNAGNNDFILASQFWIASDLYKRSRSASSTAYRSFVSACWKRNSTGLVSAFATTGSTPTAVFFLKPGRPDRRDRGSISICGGSFFVGMTSNLAR
jgi:hypothetical protein